MRTFLNRLLRNKRGQGLVEYALLIAGVALICAVGVSLFGHKAAGMIDAVAAVLPGAHNGDNGPIAVGQLIETTDASAGPIGLNLQAIQNASGQPRLGQNVAGSQVNMFGGLVADPSSTGS
jgi:pilus assembly protein Flp/PilA